MHDFNFEPKTEDELTDLLEEGEGNYEVISAEAGTSKAGNPQIKLSLKAWDKNGEQKFIYDYLVLNGSKFSMRKIKHFCESSGMEEFYKAGKFSAPDCLNRTGKCIIGKQHDDGYLPKNTIKDYVAHNNTESASKKGGMSAQDFDDDIPF
jgi:hypothetical protein